MYIKSVEAMNANNIVKSFYFTNRCEVIRVKNMFNIKDLLSANQNRKKNREERERERESERESERERQTESDAVALFAGAS